MNILLDTHIAIWAINDDRRLTKEARDILSNPLNKLYYSAVSVVEVDLKIKGRKNNIDFTTEEFVEKCEESGFIPYPLKGTHIVKANQLKWRGSIPEHRDPFDRVILAQSMDEGFKLMTHDNKMNMFEQDCVILV